MKTVNPNELNAEFRFETKSKLLRYALNKIWFYIVLIRMLNHGIRRLVPTNVSFNGIPSTLLYRLIKCVVEFNYILLCCIKECFTNLTQKSTKMFICGAQNFRLRNFFVAYSDNQPPPLSEWLITDCLE